jgi:carbon-monoxide dehydrogenase medium subunit
MKPALFDYHRPDSLAEAVALLERYDGDAKILAGGQSLMPVMNMRLARPSALIDLARVPDLRGIAFVGDRMTFGAMTRHVEAERSPEVAKRAGLLAAAMPYVGHSAIRSRGTLGGSLAHADPAAELPAVATLYDAEFTIAGSAGTRVVPWNEFFVTFLTTCLESTEILTAITFALPPAGTGWSFNEVARRHGDFALVGIAALVRLDAGADTIAEARVSLFGVGGTPARLLAQEPSFTGLRAGDAAIDELANAAAETLEPNGDVHASAQYRTDVARTLISRAVRDAAAHAAQRRTTEASK